MTKDYIITKDDIAYLLLLLEKEASRIEEAQRAFPRVKSLVSELNLIKGIEARLKAELTK